MFTVWYKERMEELLRFINDLPQDERADFAARCKTSVGYLRKACSKGQKLGPALSVAIEAESRGAVTRKHLHPLDWAEQWPELVQAA